MFMMKLLQLSFFCSLFLSANSSVVQGQTDDFDDGNDDGWARVNTLAGQGVPATWGFPNNNSYSIAMAGHGIEQLGQPRAGSFREEVTYSDFYIAVDIIFDPTIDQNMGILARVREVGLGTLDGYGAVYNPRDADPGGKIYIANINDEAGVTIGEAVPEEALGENLRIVFRGKGPELTMELYSQEDLLNPVAVAEAFDESHESGIAGIFSFSDGVTVPIDATFDNYVAAEEEPYRFEMIGAKIEGDEMTIEFYSKPGIIYSIESSNDLILWEEIDDSIEGALGDRTSFTVDYEEGVSKFFRFNALGED